MRVLRILSYAKARLLQFIIRIRMLLKYSRDGKRPKGNDKECYACRKPTKGSWDLPDPTYQKASDHDSPDPAYGRNSGPDQKYKYRT